MLASTLFVRVVPQDKDRGFMLLAGYDAQVVQRTALCYTTLSDPTRESLNTAIERIRLNNSAANVKDCTAPAVQKKLAKLFGEEPNSRGAATTAALAPSTFAKMGIGSYIE